MIVLDLRPFEVEVVGFNELFILVSNPFLNPNSLGSRPEEISRSRPEISSSRTSLLVTSFTTFRRVSEWSCPEREGCRYFKS